MTNEIPMTKSEDQKRFVFGNSGFIRDLSFVIWVWAAASAAYLDAGAADSFQVLNPASFREHIDRFNSTEPEAVTNFVSNARSYAWLRQSIPLFECPDSDVEEIYYFRWWTFRKHLVQTPTNGFVFTEFMWPVKYAGPFNTISCAAGFHLAEGRWLRNRRYVDDYTLFWFRGNEGRPQPHFHRYSSWLPSAIYDKYLVDGDKRFAINLLNDLTADYASWEQERGTNGLFWQYDVWDGMEESISGSRTNKNIRPTINSYMYANARAIADIARLADRAELAAQFDKRADELRKATQRALWNPKADFFEVVKADGQFSDAREELGFVPWCFHLPSAGCESAWSQLLDTNAFKAPYGITTAERRHPGFRSHGCCKCEWDGAIWPFATCETLWALGNVLRDYSQSVVTSRDYFDAFLTYVRSQHREGKPFIGEYLDEKTGQWLRFKPDRSYYYNHSSFADLVITGLVGLRPRADDVLEVNPLLPENTWNWFCLDGVSYHGRILTIVWDAKGDRYGKGPGLTIVADGKVIAQAPKLSKITAKL
jgi:hypothetical protein